ncbi:baseplate J/gp47 family protein [Paenibacillus thalictri]|uniref:Baseplate J/gp47 family protein n=1 Tax=Paenibacillus thalictri TaxID=2527873 RepID=A0A4Q9DI82_9BACL|nr:baseplate J/gp47 family protein [Paenibacillus thalictri]TBL71365.1 baseplate J/gp47 family protein [Paenibacillus thalictri]
MTQIPDYLTEQTEETIRRRMFARLPSDLDTTEGSYIWDSLTPAAMELAQAAIWGQEVLRRGFLATSFGTYLDLRCEEHGITRRQAVKAAGQATFTGIPGTVVPKGAIVATEADPATNTASIEFETTQAVTLDGQGKALADIAAISAGRQGNVPAAAIKVIVTPLTGIAQVANLHPMADGADDESDESLVERYLIKVRSPGTSGNKADYVQWALEVPGVGAVQVYPLWQGPGTVRVVVLNADKRAPEEELVEAVQNYICPATAGTGEGRAPIGANVTVDAAEEVPIDIQAKLILSGGATVAAAKSAIEDGVRDYLKQLAFNDSLVRNKRISAILLEVAPIIDFEDFTVNGVTSNIELGPGQVAVLGMVDVYV